MGVNNKNNPLCLEALHNLALLFNEFNNSSSQQNIDPKDVVDCRYFDITKSNN